MHCIAGGESGERFATERKKEGKKRTPSSVALVQLQSLVKSKTGPPHWMDSTLTSQAKSWFYPPPPNQEQEAAIRGSYCAFGDNIMAATEKRDNASQPWHWAVEDPCRPQTSATRCAARKISNLEPWQAFSTGPRSAARHRPERGAY